MAAWSRSAGSSGRATLITATPGPSVARLPAEDACRGGAVEQSAAGLTPEAGDVADGHRRGEPGRHGEARPGGGDVGGTQQHTVMPAHGHVKRPPHGVGAVADIDA